MAALDLQPVAEGLDLQPVDAGGGLDLQPVAPASTIKVNPYERLQAEHPELRGALAKLNGAGTVEDAANVYRGAAALPAAVLGKTAAALMNYPVQLWRADTGTPREGVVTTDAEGRETIREQDKPLPFQPGKPVMEFPRTTLQPEGNDITRLVEGLLTPENIVTFPFVAAKPVQAYFLAQSAPAAIEAAGKLVNPGLPDDERRSAATDLLVNSLMSYGLARGLVKPGPKGEAPKQTAPAPEPAKAETFSEFGDDVAQPAAAATKAETPPSLDLQPVEQAPPAPKGDVKDLAAAPPTTETTDLGTPAEPHPLVVQAVRDMAANGESIPVSTLTASGLPATGLRPGYALNAEGTAYEFTAPTPRLTPEQQQRIEAQQAMAELRAQKASTETPAPAAGLDIQPAPTVPPTGNDLLTPLVPVEVTPEEYSAAREGLRVGERVPVAMSLATEAKRAQLFADTIYNEAPGRTEPMPVNQLSVGDAFTRDGQPVKVDEWITDVETGEPTNVKVSGAFGEQTLPAGETIHVDQGSLKWTGADILAKLDSLKLDTNGQLHAFGLAPLVWNALIDGVKLAVKGGMAVKDAIEQGIAQLKTAGHTFTDETGARAWLHDQFNERATGEKVQASPLISDETKAQISQWVYLRRTNAVDATVADGLVKQFGATTAIEIFNHPPVQFPEAIRSHLIRSIGRELAAGERQARNAGDVAKADALAKQAGRFWDDALARSTELAQGLQAMRAVTDFSPDAVVARTKLEIERAAQHELDKVSDQVQTMKQALTDGKAAGIEAVKRDAEVNTTARTAVDEAVKEDPNVKRAVIMELAEPWAQSPEIVAKARELVAAKVNDLLTKAPRPPGFVAAAEFKRIADDIAKRAATIFANHVMGAEPGKPVVDKFMERLGLARPEAVKLATGLTKAWDAQLEVAKKKLDQRILMQRARQLKREAEAQTDPLVDQAIRRSLRELNQRLGDAIRQSAGERDALGRHVADRVLERSGLTGEAADKLKASLQRRWDALVGEAQQNALSAMAARAGLKVDRKLKSAFDKLVEIDRLGGLSDAKFTEQVKLAMKLKQLTPEDAAKLKQLVDAAQQQPEGFLRDQAAAEVLKLTEKLKGEVTWRDIPLAIFYANVLSGFTTPAKIMFENLNLLASTTVASLVSRPRELLNPPDLVRQVAGAYKRGIVKGALQAQGTLRTGVVSGIWDSPRHTGVLEMKPFGERLEPLNFWKWFTRGISTAHEVTFKPSWEIRQSMLAKDIARREGLTGAKLAQRVADLLADTPAEFAKARAQALKDLPAGNRADVARRTREILEEVREERMPGSTANARDYALRTAYLNEPYGVLGMIASGIRSTLEKARKEFPLAGTAAKTQIPFTTIVANILNEKLNWTPVGLLRAAASHKTGKLYGREIIDANERAELYAKAILGTIVIGATADLFGSRIHGNGPSDPNKRKQLQAAGWIPHSIEVNGEYHSYMHFPAALGLAVIGNYMDWNRYGHGEDADGMARVSFVTKATAQAIVSQGMLDSLRRFFEAIGSEDTTDGANKIEKLLARTGSAFVVPNLVNQVDRFFDPTVYDQTGAKALLTAQVPFVRRENKPVLNVLGEPVASDPFHYWASHETGDALWRVLVAQRAFIPVPAREQIIGNPNAGPEFARAMTADEYYNWIATSGPAIRDRLSERLDELATMKPEEAQALVKRIADEEHHKAKPVF